MRGEIHRNIGGRHRYQYYDVYEHDTHSPRLSAQGFQGGGPSWHGIIYGLLQLRAKALLSRIEFDPEGDGIAIWSTDEAALSTIADLVEEVKSDAVLMAQAIQIALADGQME